MMRNLMNGSLEDIQAQLLNWWQGGKQDKPLLLMSCPDPDGEPIPETDDLARHWTDVDFIMARDMARIENTRWYGVAAPTHYIDFSATAMPCSLGGRIEYVDKYTIWSHPIFERLEDVLNVHCSEEHLAYRVQMETTKRSAARAYDHHFVSTWAVGGALDTISGLYPTEDLLMDMMQRGELVEQVMAHITDIWIEEFHKDVALIEASGNRGCTCCWTGIWAPGGTFPIQEDLSYMISPDMFERFCLPCLRRMIDAVEYPLYHLDGDGALPHLPLLLEIENLPAIQWQPGAGKERIDQWCDVIRTILNGGKACQVFAEPHEIDDLVQQVGAQGLLVIVRNCSVEDAEKLMARYG